MHPNARLIHTFYTSFKQRDASAMIACYHPEVEFSDNVFPNLRAAEARAMWRMLCARGADLEVEFEGVEANEDSGRAHWIARYTFTPSGRKVENRVYARFRIEDGLIRCHRDSFNLWRWSAQALGTKGLLLGWTPLMRKEIRRQAARSLESYMHKNEAEGAAQVPEPVEQPL